MRNVRGKLKPALLVVAAALALSGCVAYPAPGYYADGGYNDPYYGSYYSPYYYGPPVVGTVVIGGGHSHHHWR